MEKIDPNMQRRVWDRVYGRQEHLTQPQRETLRRCLQRTEANLAVYEKMTGHSRYGEAFLRLATETGEHAKMLRQILGS